MDIFSTLKVFLVKTLKEKRYFWARNVFFIIFPLFFILIYLFSDKMSENGRFPPPKNFLTVNEASIGNYFCLFNKQILTCSTTLDHECIAILTNYARFRLPACV